ncbi:addiction module protein [bacterium]|nr:addiction module protein [bacterium]
MKTKDLISEALSLPVEARAQIADSILKSMNPPEAEIDKKWIQTAKQRLSELRSGKINSVPGDEVFNNIWKRYS